MLVLLGPALVGLALGQIAIWVLRLLARGATPVTATRGLPVPRHAPAVPRRRPRDPDASPRRGGRRRRARPHRRVRGDRLGRRRGPDRGRRTRVVVPVENGAFGAWRLTERARPRGRAPHGGRRRAQRARLAERRAYVDAARFDAVAGDFYADTPVRAARLRDATHGAVTPPIATGSRFAGDRVGAGQERTDRLQRAGRHGPRRQLDRVGQRAGRLRRVGQRSGSSTVTGRPDRGSARAARRRAPRVRGRVPITGLRRRSQQPTRSSTTRRVRRAPHQAELGGLTCSTRPGGRTRPSIETAANDRFTRFDASRPSW